MGVFMSIRTAFVAISVCALAALPASAQDVDGRPNYGELSLDAGFADDPRIVDLAAGGDLNADRVSSDCRGFITNAPDYRLHYNSGSLPLIISVASQSDTTLVVNGPDGSWYCDDDGGENGLNPSVRFNEPLSGRYEIWVGTYSSGATQPAELHISELGSQ